MAAATSFWEDLRKQARQLENEIDLKLVSFGKLGTSYGTKVHPGGAEAVPLLSGANGVQMFDTMAMEIEQLLLKLTGVNDKMADYAQSPAKTSPNTEQLHMLQRHREILKDYTHDFQKTKTNIQARKEREDLLGSVRRDIDAYKNSSGLNRRSELYMKENEHLRSSDRLVDEQISIALETKDHLLNQRFAYKAIQNKLNNLAKGRFPMINSLIQRVNLRKRRDSIIIGLVISICIILLILYAFH